MSEGVAVKEVREFMREITGGLGGYHLDFSFYSEMGSHLRL